MVSYRKVRHRHELKRVSTKVISVPVLINIQKRIWVDFLGNELLLNMERPAPGASSSRATKTQLTAFVVTMGITAEPSIAPVGKSRPFRLADRYGGQKAR